MALKFSLAPGTVGKAVVAGRGEGEGEERECSFEHAEEGARFLPALET